MVAPIFEYYLTIGPILINPSYHPNFRSHAASLREDGE